MSRTFKNIILLLCTLCCFHQIVCVEYVPVYMWETAKHTEAIPALDRISEDSFKDLILERLVRSPFVVVFVERNLSPEDFAQRDDSGDSPFPNLVKLRSDAKVTYWPFVHNPLHAVKQLDKKLLEVSADNALEELDVSKDSILVVNLNDARDEEDRSEMLKRHDSIIAQVYNEALKKYDNVLALYTGRHTSWVIPDEVRSGRQTRSLLAVKEDETADTRQLFNTTYVLLYLNSTGTYQNNTVSANLSDYTSVQSTSTNTSITLTFTETGKPTFTFGFAVSGGYWNLSSITVQEGSNAYSLKVKNVYAPERFSYHCTSQVFYGQDSSQNLSLPGLQVQALTEGQISQFGDAYDCVGFTTAPIWSGLFVTFILALIMTFGLSMMMDIKTMDRFDDPKGKTITVNVSE